MAHRLDPLLRPRSVAVVGASDRNDSLGEWGLKNLLRGGFAGPIYPINPRYDEVQGVKCFANLAELPEVPDLVIFGVSDHRIEAAVDDAITAGVPAAVIMSTLYIDDDPEPQLRERVQKKIAAAGMLVCGANGMGFYNVRDHVWACGFDSADHEAPGKIALISHSGSGMSGLIDCDERLRVNVAVSTGNELSVSMDEYLDFVLDLPETRAVGLFIETARDPQGFRAALDKANQRRVPIVAIKVGRTEESARLAISHSGAIAGDDAAYEALFDRYGVQRVRDMDELATTLILFAELPVIGEGSLVSLHDSGGERQLMIDLADSAGVPLTTLCRETVEKLESVLDPELPAVNPLDAWSRGGPDARHQMTQSLTILMQDPGAAMGALIHDRAPCGKVYASYLGYMRHAVAETGKPVVLVAARQGTGHDEAVVTSTSEGLPVLDGVPAFLKGAHALFAYRDFLQQEAGLAPETDSDVVGRWRERLGVKRVLGELESLQLLADFRIETVIAAGASDQESLLEAAADIGYPLALKTANPDVAHKSDSGGVVLDIRNDAELSRQHAMMSAALGPDVNVAQMAEDGVEMILGMKRDPQFGPIVLLGFGGVHAESLNDVQYLLAPFSADHAKRCINRLRLRPMLDGVRGRPAADVKAFCETAARFSTMVHTFRGLIEEVDVNPVIVHGRGCTAVDALVVASDCLRPESC
jgi:acyl-CoA synthetase (NDP forming)